MMIREIINTYLQSNRLKVDKGNEGDFSPILPLIIMDEAYQIFCKYIRPIECRFESNRLKKDWMKEYHTFNQSYFSHFNQEQIDFIIDLMDENEAFLHNDLMMVFVHCSDLIMDEPFERKQVLAAGMMIDVLSSIAELFWEKIFRNAYEPTNSHLKRMDKGIIRWCSLYHGDKSTVNPNNSDVVEKSVYALINKQMKFLTQHYV